MRLRPSSIVFVALAALAGASVAAAPAHAHGGNIAERCDSRGCDVIRCDDTGDRCTRLDGRTLGDRWRSDRWRSDRRDGRDGYARRGHRHSDRSGYRRARGSDDGRYRDAYWQCRGYEEDGGENGSSDYDER